MKLAAGIARSLQADLQAELRDIGERLTESCRAVDPTSTDEIIQQAKASADVVKGEAAEATEVPATEVKPDFGAGLFD